MSREMFDELPTRQAERLVRELGITSLPVDPIAIAMSRGIDVVERPSNLRGNSGMLIRHGEEYVIAYASHIGNEGFKRFSIGHELGHYFLDGHCDHVLPVGSTVHYSRAGFGSRDRHELEADHFSAGLLMPRGLFTKEVERAGSGFEAIENLSRKCVTSLTATAIRYSQCANDPVAALVTDGGEVDYCFLSRSLRDIQSLTWLGRGSRVPPRSATAQIGADTGRIERCERFEATATLREWFGDDAPDIEIYEDAVGLGSYGKVLTILFADDLPDAEEEEEEEELEESWRPTFHRSRRR